MSKKHLRTIALIITLAFVAVIVVYPLIFGTDEQEPNQAPPQLELNQ